MLGDNPMQSELSCHIGLHGKFFCRCCFVKGKDSSEDTAGGATVFQRQSSRARSGSQSEASDCGSSGSEQSGRRKEQEESAQDMLDRVKRFLKV